MSAELSKAALAGLQADMDELTARAPVELVPMVRHPITVPTEILSPECGLTRRPSGWKPGDTELRATWTANEHDELPCYVSEVGVVHEPGGPWLFTVPVATPWPGVLVERPGQVVDISIPWPIQLVVSAT